MSADSEFNYAFWYSLALPGLESHWSNVVGYASGLPSFCDTPGTA